MNGTWGYSITDRNYKSVAALIHLLVNAAGRNANLLLNVGPQPDGEIPQASLERLREVGRWMKTYGETVYGTRAGEIAPGAWGVSTRKGDRLFVHVLRRDGDTLSLPLTGGSFCGSGGSAFFGGHRLRVAGFVRDTGRRNRQRDRVIRTAVNEKVPLEARRYSFLSFTVSGRIRNGGRLLPPVAASSGTFGS